MPIFLSNSKIQIIFTDVPGVDEVINLTETSLGLNLNTIFKLTRTTTGQTQLPTYIPESYPNLERWVGFISANYKTSFVTDYGSLGFTLFSTNDTTFSACDFANSRKLQPMALRIKNSFSCIKGRIISNSNSGWGCCLYRS